MYLHIFDFLCNKHVLWSGSILFSVRPYIHVYYWLMHVSQVSPLYFPQDWDMCTYCDKDDFWSFPRNLLALCIIGLKMLLHWSMGFIGEVQGCHWKHAIFYIFAPCHQIRIRCSDRCRILQSPVWVFALFQLDTTVKKTINSNILAKTLHSMWSLSGLSFFLLTLSL